MQGSAELQDRRSLLSSAELLCIPFLDTDTRNDTKYADAVLSSRGYPHWLVWFLRRVLAVGLWTQVFIWDECSLDIGDVLFGYGLLFVFVGLLTIWLHFGIWLAGIGVLFVVLALWFWRRRRIEYENFVRDLNKQGEP